MKRRTLVWFAGMNCFFTNDRDRFVIARCFLGAESAKEAEDEGNLSNMLNDIAISRKRKFSSRSSEASEPASKYQGWKSFDIYIYFCQES